MAKWSQMVSYQCGELGEGCARKGQYGVYSDVMNLKK